MLSKKICEFLSNLELCETCILRYIKKNDFSRVSSTSENIDFYYNRVKKAKPSICVACLGLLQDIGSVADVIVNRSDLCSYECSSLYSSISIPITILIRELSIWIALIKHFPNEIDDSKTVFFL